MANIEFQLNLPGLNELMKSSAMQAHLHQAGAAVAGAAGTDYGHTTYVLNWVAVENIYPASEEAARENYQNNTLLTALGSVGLSPK